MFAVGALLVVPGCLLCVLFGPAVCAILWFFVVDGASRVAVVTGTNFCWFGFFTVGM